MKTGIVRKVDYWVGIPICFILLIFDKVRNIYAQRELKKNTRKNILFLELSEMGSAVLAYSAIKKAKEIYPDAHFYFWIFSKNQDSVMPPL